MNKKKRTQLSGKEIAIILINLKYYQPMKEAVSVFFSKTETENFNRN